METKKFRNKLLLVIAFVIIIHAAVLPFVNGDTLLYYYKFSSPPQQSLIIGTSRASQGVLPGVLKDSLGKEVFNFAFHGTGSPYGEVYTKAIMQKLEPNSKGGEFILCVDPWAVSAFTDSLTGEVVYPDQKQILNKLHWMSCNPNVEYLWREYNFGWGAILYNHFRSNSTVTGRPDGWTEVTRDMSPSQMEKRKRGKIENMEKSLERSFISDVRLNALQDLIVRLKERGEVYLVRLPISKEIYEIETRLCSDFDLRVQSIANNADVPYLMLQDRTDEMVFNDGHHLNRAYAPACTAIIAHWIKEQER